MNFEKKNIISLHDLLVFQYTLSTCQQAFSFSHKILHCTGSVKKLHSIIFELFLHAKFASDNSWLMFLKTEKHKNPHYSPNMAARGLKFWENHFSTKSLEIVDNNLNMVWGHFYMLTRMCPLIYRYAINVYYALYNLLLKREEGRIAKNFASNRSCE